jgi:hypothetical protein
MSVGVAIMTTAQDAASDRPGLSRPNLFIANAVKDSSVDLLRQNTEGVPIPAIY